MDKAPQDKEERWQKCLMSPISGHKVSDSVVKTTQFGTNRNFTPNELVIIRRVSYDDDDNEIYKYRYAYWAGVEHNKNGTYQQVIRKNKIQKMPVAKIIDSSGYVTKVVPIWANIKPENIASTSQIPPLTLLIQGSLVKLLLEEKKSLHYVRKILPAELFELIEKQYLIEKCRQAYEASLYE